MIVLILANHDLGLYKFRKELIEELLVRGYDVFISLPYGDLVRPLEKMGCSFINTPVDRRGINPIKDFKLLITYREIMKRVNPDIVITYTIKPNIYGGIIARFAHFKYAVNITGLGTAFDRRGILRKIVVILYRIALKNAKVVFFENKSNRDVLVTYGCCAEQKTVVLNGAGVNIDHYEYQPYPHNEIMRFLFIGRIMKEKGIDELIEATKMLIMDGEECVLDIVGPLDDDYREIMKRYDNEKWFNYYGYREDVRPFIKQCDCFVLPSYHEGMANTVLECASSGRPIITSNIPGCKEAVIDGISGYLCKPRCTNSLYSAMKLMINNENREKMGLVGREHIKKYFDKKEVVKETIKHLEK